MKNRYFFLFTFFTFLCGFSCVSAQDQWNAGGVWTGHLYNDTTKSFIPFELALSNTNGQVSGYSYTVFMIDSVANIGVKEVTVKEKNDLIIIRDKKLIDNNYTDAPAKGVFTTFEMEHSENDTADILSGQWFTNKTKEFYPVTGTVFLTKKKEVRQTKIVPKLIALGLGNRLSFLHNNWKDVADNKQVVKTEKEKKSIKKDSMITIVEPEVVITIPKDSSKNIKLPSINDMAQAFDSTIKPKSETAKTSGIVDPKPVDPILEKHEKSAFERKNEKPPTISPKKPEVSNDKKEVAQKSILQNPEKSASESKPEHIKQVLVVNEKKQDKIKTPDTKIKSPVSVTPAPLKIEEKKPAQVVLQNPEKSAFERKNEIVQQAPKDLSTRKIETIRTVNVVHDSLVLTLYDNGAVDGDTVSVLLNGEVVISKVGLLEKAYNKTIYLTPEMGDSIRIILYAENLGSIPPNTGLLVVRDGDKDYEIRFTGDLQKNSAIILTRKKE